MYDADYPTALLEIEASVEGLRRNGAKRITVAGQSLGANASIAYAASGTKVDGVMAFAPGHAPDLQNFGASVAKARQMIAGGKAEETASFDDNNQGQMQIKSMLGTLRALLLMPLWLLQLLHVSKSFEENPIIGSRPLNRLGLHALRVVLAHGVTRLRWTLLAPLLPSAQRRLFRDQGYLIFPNFLPAQQFGALDDEVRNYRGEVRECVQGDTQTHRTLLDDQALHDLPACQSLLYNRTYRRVLQWAAVRFGQPLIFIENVRNGFVGDGGADPQKDLHADTFHPTMKAWLYLDDVTEANGPFAYVTGSNQLTWRRLRWEYHQSVQGRRLPDRYSRRGSLRLTEEDRQRMGLPEPQRFTVPANTLVIANTFGFHARSAADRGSTRLAIYADSRTNPFNPWPGLDLPWPNQFKYRAFQWYRRRQDRLAARNGALSSWHQVDPDTPDTKRTAI